MLVLLPPSETKRDPQELSTAQSQQLLEIAGLAAPTPDTASAAAVFTANSVAAAAVPDTANTAAAEHPGIQQLVTGERECAAQQVLAALAQLSAAADEKAHKSLKLRPGAKAQAAFAANLSVSTAPRLPAAAIYTGVLYDALDYLSLPATARQWLHQHVAVQSALYGLLGAGELIANYRLSAGSSLPQLGTTLKKHWNRCYTDFAWDDFGVILDLRSNDYASLAPCTAAKVLRPEFASRQADGSLKSLNHFNKAGKGRLVRELALAAPECDTVTELMQWVADSGIEVAQQPDGKIMFVL